MDAEHEIFNRPFDVEPTFEDMEVPDHYRRYHEGRDLPETIPGWKVHGSLEKKNYGLVSDGYGFEDTPDCEFIAGGLNSKGPRSLALGRQGNWFLWGFCASPPEMTGEARKVFLNTVVYMDRFDGHGALCKRVAPHRRWALQYATFMKAGGKLREYGSKKFAPALLEAGGGEAEKLIPFLEKNLDYLRYETRESGGGRFTLDAEARELGIPNRDPALLERCVTLLEEGGADAEAARRLLQRYTGGRDRDAAAWRAWLEANSGRLVFTDTGGYRFLAVPRREAARQGGGG